MALPSGARRGAAAPARTHVPLRGDSYRLPSGRIVMVLLTDADAGGEPVARCFYADTKAPVNLSARFLVLRGWRLA